MESGNESGSTTVETNLGCERGQPRRVLACLAAALWPWFWLLPFGERVQYFFCRLSSEVLLWWWYSQKQVNVPPSQTAYIEVISDDYHRSITARSLTFNLNNGELAVLCCLTRLDPAQCVTDSVQNLRRTAQHARCCGANLNKMLSNRLTDTSC